MDSSSSMADTADRIANLDAALDSRIYDSRSQYLRLRDVLANQQKSATESSHKPSTPRSSLSFEDVLSPPAQELRQRVLVVFIRHFFCGNCQEYLRELASHPAFSDANLEQQNLRVVVVGCGAPSHIDSYRTISNMPGSWQLFADPTTAIYTAFGMKRTLSMGKRRPEYIRRSLTGNMLRSVLQGVRRIPEGDVLAAGSLDINGGEFLFEKTSEDSWRITWSYRMTNSRDHTEVEALLVKIGIQPKTALGTVLPTLARHQRTKSSPIILSKFRDGSLSEKPEPLTQIKRTDSFRRNLAQRRQSWMSNHSGLGRVMSLRTPRQAIAA